MDPDLENTYLVLLGLAEKFRNEPYSNCMLSLKCLKAILNLPVEPEIHYSVYLKIGKILYTIYNEIDISKTYFEKSWYSSISDTKYTSALYLAKIYQTEKNFHDAERLLKQCLTLTKEKSIWYSVFIIELTQTYLNSKDNSKTMLSLENGLEYAKIHLNENTFFIHLSYCIFLLITNNSSKLEETLEALISTLKKLQTSIRKDNLTLYMLLIQIIHNLVQGKGKSVKPYLKKLQQLLQGFAADEEEDMELLWLPKPYIILLSYVLIVVHALQVGYMERALKYIDKGLLQIQSMKDEHHTQNDRLKSLDFSDAPISPYNTLFKFETCLREYLIVAQLVTGKYGSGLEEIQRCFLHDYPGIKRAKIETQKPRLHLFLGLYTLATKEYDKAQSHFSLVRIQNFDEASLATSYGPSPFRSTGPFGGSNNSPLAHNSNYLASRIRDHVFACFNLLLMYLHLNRNNFFNTNTVTGSLNSPMANCAFGVGGASCLTLGGVSLNLEIEIRKILEHLDPEVMISDDKTPYIFKSAINFIYSLWHFCKRDFNESKKYLREALKMSNAEDINRMTAFSLLLLGQIFIHSQNFQDCLTMLNPGCQLSVKIQDPCSQIWASVLYKQMYQATGNEDQYKESLELTTKLSETFAKEYQDAINAPMHKKLIIHF